jgi:flavin-dependent dehydrogenase
VTEHALIIGGGLAGSATALQLRRSDVRVTLVERAAFPREKPCGEGLLPHGVSCLRALGLGDVIDDPESQPFRGILYRAHGALAVGDFEDDERGFGLRRSRLDARIQDEAVKAGADLVTGEVAHVELGDDGVRARLRSGAWLDADFLIGADGPRSRVRRALGLDAGPPRRGRYAIRRHFRLARGMPLNDRVEVSALRGHELYLTPVGADVVGIAALVEKSVLTAGSGRPEERLARLIEAAPDAVRARFDGAEPIGPALACGPLRVRCRRPWRHRALLVGDAAGYVDAITGEGMSLALRTATVAGDAAARAMRGEGDLPLREYARARAGVFRDHALLTHGLVFLARRPWLARRAIGRLAADPALFTRLLAVNNGTRSLTSLGVLDVLKLAVGRGPGVVEDPAPRALPA